MQDENPSRNEIYEAAEIYDMSDRRNHEGIG